MDIRTIAVLGSGVMGSGIAALCANAGLEVALLDIVPEGAANRNELAEKAIAKQLASGGFTHPDNARRITPGNLEDADILLARADWIIEAVVEKLDIKQHIYRNVDAVRKKGSIVSSNTSTLPLHELVGGMSDAFARDFLITHFFNPPRHMRLLELVAGPKTHAAARMELQAFADERLGKEVVECKDTPGFIANRIGVYWMVAGLVEALRLGISVEEADAVMGKPIGLPKTGVFGLYDLIGLDLIPLIAKAMLAYLPPQDDFRTLYQEPELLKKLIAEGYTGRKGKGGFYRMRKEGDAKIREVLDLGTGEYRAEKQIVLKSAKARNINELLAADDIGGQYAWAVLSRTFAYTASLIPEIADSIADVDTAMKEGYSWKYGVFELLDQLGINVFAERLHQEGRPVPTLLTQAKGRPLYAASGNQRQALRVNGAYAPIPKNPGYLWLSDVKQTATPVLANESASLWDLGDGIACLELTTKMNAVDEGVLALIEQALARISQDFKGMVIGNDGTLFCAGANLNVFLAHAQREEWSAVSDLIRTGQRTMLALKTAPFPVVASLAGLALGGGCEIVLHSVSAQAHMECSPGLVEAIVGLIPAWGGCKEMLLRHDDDAVKAFDLIISGKKAGSAQEAAEMKFLRDGSAISMNRARLLADAKAHCLSLASAYKAPELKVISTGGATVKNAILHRLENWAEQSHAAPHDLVIGRVLAHVLSGGEMDGAVSEQDMMDLEHDGFMELLRTTASQQRIAHMLGTGKPLRN